MTDKFNMILYGESGVGKTALCGTLQACDKTSPCLFLDVDGGTMSLDSGQARPTVLPISKWSQVAVVYDKLSKEDWQGLADYIGKVTGWAVSPVEYRSVVIDSGTELEYMLRQLAVSENPKPDRDEIPTQPDYMVTQERFRKMYRRFKALPLSLVMTAGIRELKEESTGVIKRSPDFQPTLAHDLVRMTDFVIYMSVTMSGMGKEATWTKYLLTSLSQRFIARSRSDALPRVMEGEKFYFGRHIVERILP